MITANRIRERAQEGPKPPAPPPRPDSIDYSTHERMLRDEQVARAQEVDALKARIAQLEAAGASGGASRVAATAAGDDGKPKKKAEGKAPAGDDGKK